MSTARAVGLLLGFGLDATLGDPRRGHPVAGFGTAARALERRRYRPDRAAGTAYVGVLVGAVTLGGVAIERLARRGGPATETAVVAAATYVVLGGTSLLREGAEMSARLERGDLGAARERLSHLCARDPSRLGEDELARATVESLAENTSDAVVAPLLWGAVAGVPGLLGYRAVNTLDAMVGYRNDRYADFGWAAARLDDAANWLPARATALVTVGIGPDRAGAWRIWRRDADLHPSPNAGPVEAAFAGALGIRLGGENRYHGITENRGVMGDGRAVTVPDVAAVGRLSRRVGVAALVVAVAAALLRSRR
ncbi:cobalamin biosynthesis protein [Nocardioides limicola]|uniref:cobalamin biosynthesis protein n=1 Tax=Nocardioides limicola TaxID=2803368 RepID=UPI00193C0508|nr:cobalamin biosynthesis protein [Nocardioides sp. DJM-14]